MKRTAIYFCFLLFVIKASYLACTTDSKTNQSPIVKNKAMTVSSAPGKTWVAKKLGSKESLITVQFIDQAHGWIVSRKGHIHVTSDGGETWELRRVDIPLNAEVSASFFVDSMTGWISVVRMSADVLRPNETRAWLMKTEDGGNTWLAQYSQEALQLSRIFFVNAQEGWAVGSRSIRRETLQSDPLVLHSADAGKHWVAISEPLPKGGGFLEDAHYDKSRGLVVLNSEGHVFSTSDGGAHWQSMATVPDEPDQTYFGRFGGLADKRLWFLGGSASYEGTYGVLAFMGPDTTWTRLETNAYLTDLMFLTTDKVIACGFTSERSGSHHGKRGIIMRSSDGGRSWVKDIPPDSNAAFTALARAGNHIWVVGEEGYVAMLKDF